MSGDWSAGEVAVEVGCAAGAGVGVEGVVGDVADADPAEALVEAVGVTVGDGIENEEGSVVLARGGFGGAHEGFAEAAAACAGVNEHLDEVGAVGLVVGKIEDELDGAADAVGVFGDEERAVARSDGGGDLAPEGEGVVA